VVNKGVAIVLVLLFGDAHRSDAQSATPREVKAAFMYNFARFTEWPIDAFVSESAALVIGVAGDEALRRNVDNVVRGKFAGSRALKTQHVKNPRDMAGIQMLYIGATAASRTEEFVQALNGEPVLTVGEVDGFIEKGGMINFLIADNRLRFEIGWNATEHSRLKVSSRVLTLALTLHGTSKP
jgi:hypothetical protein